jgi:hypothetical protein
MNDFNIKNQIKRRIEMLSLVDRNKLINAGFRIFRRQKFIKQITECRGEKLGWYKYGEYKSYAEMDRIMNKLMEDSKNIEDK